MHDRISRGYDVVVEEHLPRLTSRRNASDQESMLRKLAEPELGRKLVPEVTPLDIDRLLSKVAEGRARPHKESVKRKKPLQPPKPTPIRANRCGEVLRKMFSLAIDWKMRSDNPAQGFRRRPEVERDRYLSQEELGNLAAALNAAEDQRAVGIVRLCMLTGARVGEVRQARFDQFNLELMLWTKQAATVKRRKIHRVPISDDAAALVRLRREAVPEDCSWLFPGDVNGQPVTEIRRFWDRIRAETECRTYGSTICATPSPRCLSRAGRPWK